MSAGLLRSFVYTRGVTIQIKGQSVSFGSAARPGVPPQTQDRHLRSMTRLAEAALRVLIHFKDLTLFTRLSLLLLLVPLTYWR